MTTFRPLKSAVLVFTLLVVSGCSSQATHPEVKPSIQSTPTDSLSGDWISKTVADHGLGYWVTIKPESDGTYTGRYYAEYQNGTFAPSEQIQIERINDSLINVIWPDGRNSTEQINGTKNAPELWLDSNCWDYFTDIQPSTRTDCQFIKKPVKW